MKKLYIPLLTIAMLIGSCTDMLDQKDPSGPSGEDFFKTGEDLQLAVVAAYSALSSPNSPYREGIIGFEQLSDNFYHGSTTTDGRYPTWTTYNYSPADANILNAYTAFYQLVNQCNQVIERGTEADVTEEVLNQAIAEARFLRGFGYFMLTLIWGDVPLVTSLTSDPAGFAVAASPAEEVYNQIIEDLQFAETNLSPTPADLGRATSWTAKAMLAKVYLFGADELGKAEWYSLAEQKAAEVVNGGPYGLFDELPTPQENLRSIFQFYNENGEEHIFNVNHYNSGSNWGEGHVATNVAIAMNPNQPSLTNANMRGYGFAYVYEAVDVLWPDEDARKDYALWFHGEEVVVNGEVKGTYDQTAQVRCCARDNGMAFQKFWYQENTKNANGSSGLDYPVLRYAELLLIHAEADLLSDGTLNAEGLASLNEVRNRAGLTDLDVADVTIETILEERRWELFGEGKRWFDFVRKRNVMPDYIFDSFDAIVANDTNDDDNDFGGFNPSRHWKLPYPQSAVDRNPALQQKPAWAAE